jgi:hypothetical protein
MIRIGNPDGAPVTATAERHQSKPATIQPATRPHKAKPPGAATDVVVTDQEGEHQAFSTYEDYAGPFRGRARAVSHHSGEQVAVLPCTNHDRAAVAVWHPHNPKATITLPIGLANVGEVAQVLRALNRVRTTVEQQT